MSRELEKLRGDVGNGSRTPCLKGKGPFIGHTFRIKVHGLWGTRLSRLYLAAKRSHMGVDVDGLVCPLHHPMVYSHQTRGQGFLSGTALSHRATVGGGVVDAEPRGMVI
jgi:hypothetical protein